MNSPYLGNGVGGNWGPAPGLAQSLANYQANALQGVGEIGQFAGLAGAAIGGAVQAHANPGVFGANTSPASAAWQGAAQNINAVRNGGQNFKQLQQAAKTADSFRELLKSSQLTGPDEEANVFGTDDEWKTLSATEKFARVGQAMQAQQMKGQALAYKKGLQDYAAAAQQMQMREQQMKQQNQASDVQNRFAQAYQAGNPDAVVGQLTPQNRLDYALQQVPQAMFDPNLDNAARMVQSGAAKTEFTPQGGTASVGGWNIPWVRTSPGQAQILPEIATDSGGKINPRFTHESAGLAAKDRLNAALKTVDRISRIPETRRTAADRDDLEEARAAVRELQGGGGGGSASGDDLWKQFMNSRK